MFLKYGALASLLNVNISDILIYQRRGFIPHLDTVNKALIFGEEKLCGK